MSVGSKRKVEVGRIYNYAYRLTEQCPCTLSCYHAQVDRATTQAIRQAMAHRDNLKTQWLLTSNSVDLSDIT